MTGAQLPVSSGTRGAGRRSGNAVVAHGAALVSVAAMATFLLWRSAEPVLRSVLLLVSIIAFGTVFARRSWRGSLSLRGVLILSAAVLVVAVIAKPNGTDLWYYQMYGRIVAHYHESPYKH